MHSIPPELVTKLASSVFICGADEVGYGAWSGPVVACAVVVPRQWSMPGVTDSKKLTEKRREALYPELIKLPHAIAEAHAEEIDRIGLGAAWDRVMRDAIAEAIKVADQLDPLIIIDGVKGVFGAATCPKGDTLIPAISAASIIGKVYRDRMMLAYDAEFPHHAFGKHKGYGTAKHAAALKEHGVTPIHRRSYRPIQELLGEEKPPQEDPPHDDLSDLISKMEF